MCLHIIGFIICGLLTHSLSGRDQTISSSYNYIFQ
uniref:Uncharacterized protein n=1 Tax=Siphoviridae sp. ctLqe90 TaxID=2825456 RepID=A0A8S5Q286_9CAUD|nr:MAG TPA: hypothetical protein [Siphoviridae sp. ctLqe90]